MNFTTVKVPKEITDTARTIHADDPRWFIQWWVEDVLRKEIERLKKNTSNKN